MAPAAAAGSSSAGVLEADAAHSHDPQYFTDYVNEIHDHYRSVEVSPSSRCCSCGTRPSRAKGGPRLRASGLRAAELGLRGSQPLAPASPIADGKAPLPKPAPMSFPLHGIELTDGCGLCQIPDSAVSFVCPPPPPPVATAQERKTARHGYMAHQTDVNAKMRAILVDWLLEVHFKFKLLPETLYLTVNIIDRYLERKPVVRTKLQLVGVTAMLVASKYEEIYPPEVKDFVFITSNAYSHEEILDMEARMLNALRFEVTVPTAWIFLGRYCKVAMLDTRTKLLAQYYVERCLQEYDMLRFLPSLQASAAVHAAMRTLGTGTWTPTMVAYTGFTEADLAEPLAEVERYVCHHSASLKASRKKFGSKRFHDIASVGVACADGTIAGATAPRA